jgi:hypothetical protein
MKTQNPGRRLFHRAAIGAAVGAAAAKPMLVHAADKQAQKTFVLVHGAWYGGWCWSNVAKALRDSGHIVSTPTCPGVGEQRHLLSKDISLTTFVTSIVNHIKYENLSNVILVGSGFAGVVISGVADSIPGALKKLVFLDAMVLPSGLSVFEAQPPAITKARIEQMHKEGGGIAIPPPPLASYRVGDPEVLKWLEARLTPQPAGTYTEKLVLRNPIGNGVPKVYVDCNASPYPPLANLKKTLKSEPGWIWTELNTHHDPMITEPKLLADFLRAA